MAPFCLPFLAGPLVTWGNVSFAVLLEHVEGIIIIIVVLIIIIINIIIIIIMVIVITIIHYCSMHQQTKFEKDLLIKEGFKIDFQGRFTCFKVVLKQVSNLLLLISSSLLLSVFIIMIIIIIIILIIITTSFITITITLMHAQL